MLSYHLLFDPQSEKMLVHQIPVDIKESNALIELILEDLRQAGADSSNIANWTVGDSLLTDLCNSIDGTLSMSTYDEVRVKILAHKIRGYQLRLAIMNDCLLMQSTINLLRGCLFRYFENQYHSDLGILESQTSHPHCPARQTNDNDSAFQTEFKFILRTDGASSLNAPTVVKQGYTDFASFSASKIPDNGTYKSHLKLLREAMSNRNRSHFGADPRMIARQDPHLDKALQDIGILVPTSSPYAFQETKSTGNASTEEVDETTQL